MPRGRPGHQRGVGDPASDDDVGVCGQCLDDAPHAEIGVDCDGIETARSERFARIEIGESVPALDERVEARGQIVAVDNGDGRMQPDPLRRSGNGIRAPAGIESAGIADDPDSTVETVAAHVLDLADERPGVSGSRPPLSTSRQDRHRQLGQPVTGEDADRTAVDHLAIGSETVAVETAAVRDDERTTYRHSHPMSRHNAPPR